MILLFYGRNSMLKIRRSVKRNSDFKQAGLSYHKNKRAGNSGIIVAKAFQRPTDDGVKS
jgi:hypothetical protein